MNSPYAPPKSVVTDRPDAPDSAAEQTRREHILHEVRLKSIGSLYYLGCLFSAFAGIGIGALILTSPDTTRGGGFGAMQFMLLLFYLVFAAIFGVLGYGFRRIQPWIRIPGGIFATLGLLAFPIGTLINAHILYLLFSARGAMVLSAPYQAIMAATPHVKYKRSVGDWIAISVLLALLLGGLLLAIVGASSR